MKLVSISGTSWKHRGGLHTNIWIPLCKLLFYKVIAFDFIFSKYSPVKNSFWVYFFYVLLLIFVTVNNCQIIWLQTKQNSIWKKLKFVKEHVFSASWPDWTDTDYFLFMSKAMFYATLDLFFQAHLLCHPWFCYSTDTLLSATILVLTGKNKLSTEHQLMHMPGEYSGLVFLKHYEHIK